MMDKKILIAYFSYEGNTRKIAEKIEMITGGELFEIRPIQAYSDNYDTTERQARQEANKSIRPELAEMPHNIADYDIIFIGTPNWFNKVAPPVATFLSKNDFSNKTIIPFCTHGGNGVARIAADIAKYATRSHILECLDIYGNGGSNADASIEEWFHCLNV